MTVRDSGRHRHLPLYFIGEDAAFAAVAEMCQPLRRAVRHFRSPAAFLTSAGTLPAGCVLMDLSEANVPPPGLVQLLREQDAVRSIILQMVASDVDVALRAVRQGVADVLTGPYDSGRFAEALGYADRQPAGDRRPLSYSAIQRLSGREREVLDGLVRGLTNRSIATELGISHRTVEIHRAHLMRKLGATSLSAVLGTALGFRSLQGGTGTEET